MGLEPSYLEFIEECVAATLGQLRGLRMLELGDQTIASDAIPENTGKAYYENRGVAHTSFDLNGANGALRVDLSRRIRKRAWLGAFDVVTNSGTTEHVEPYDAQYVCFLNVHNCLRPGGVAISLVPDVEELDRNGAWKNHCNHYYSHAFFARLAELNRYDMVASKLINGLRCAALRKTRDAPFTRDRAAVLAGIARREGGMVYRGINDRRSRSFKRRFRRAVRSLFGDAR
jgi:hypothetical protein